MILARTKIMDVLKSKNAIASSSGALMRKSLIVMQFVISLFLITVTSIIINQVNFMKKTNLGYDREHVIVMPIGGSMLDNLEILKDAFTNVQGVESVTASYETPEFVEWGDGIDVVGKNGKMEISLNAMPVYLDFAQTLGMKFAAGRDFDINDFALMDTTNNSENFQLPYIINETLAEMIGWTPKEAIGKSIENRAEGPVVGVVEDFHFTSLHEPVGPVIQFLSRDYSRVLMAKINGNDINATLDRLESTWNTRITDRPFNYHFLDDDYEKLYASEERSTALFKSASLLAIVLAALGLFGLAAFMNIKRTKEIGIRRVLGASISSISILFVRQFLGLVGIAILIAIPLAWIAGNRWLQDFAYKIDVAWWHFVVSGLLVIGIAIITISYHAIRACYRNPVNSLRAE